MSSPATRCLLVWDRWVTALGRPKRPEWVAGGCSGARQQKSDVSTYNVWMSRLIGSPYVPNACMPCGSHSTICGLHSTIASPQPFILKTWYNFNAPACVGPFRGTSLGTVAAPSVILVREHGEDPAEPSWVPEYLITAGPRENSHLFLNRETLAPVAVGTRPAQGPWTS